MKEIIFGILSGIVAALGMGGGTILILLLGIFTEIEQHFIQGINLVVFIPTSIVAILMNIKNKTINYKQALPIIILGIVGAFLGSFLAFKFDNRILKKLFGIFLIIIAILESYSFFRQYIRRIKMKFTKGIILGSLLTAGAMMMYSEGIDTNKKKMIKKGKQFARKMKIPM